MSTIGILAYGSLIEDPGTEIKPIIRERKEGITTPFSIEFARSVLPAMVHLPSFLSKVAAIQSMPRFSSWNPALVPT